MRQDTRKRLSTISGKSQESFLFVFLPCYVYTIASVLEYIKKIPQMKRVNEKFTTHDKTVTLLTTAEVSTFKGQPCTCLMVWPCQKGEV